MNNELNPNDIYIEILCECAERVLVIAYRRTILEKHLFLHGSRAFLSRYGYPKTGQLEACLAILKKGSEMISFRMKSEFSSDIRCMIYIALSIIAERIVCLSGNGRYTIILRKQRDCSAALNHAERRWCATLCKKEKRLHRFSVHPHRE